MKTITRQDILKAIATEPLEGGSWVFNFGTYAERAKRAGQSCPVCAVGAVLRRAGVSDDSIERAAQRLMSGSVSCHTSGAQDDDIEANLKAGEYLAALSGKFETTWDKYYQNRLRRFLTRRELSKFVKKNFPKSIRIPLAEALVSA